MDLAHPYTALCSPLEGGALSVLAGTTRPMTGREIARLMGRSSHSGVLIALNRLADHGVVEREEAGRALLFTLNREHLVAPAVDVLAHMRTEVIDRLRSEVGAWEIAAAHVSLFGSFARGEGNTESDIDLLVIRPKKVKSENPRWREQLDLLARQVRRWTGNPAGIVEVGKGEIPQLREEAPPILEELRNDAITVVGAETQALLGEH
ncbi:MAG: nucleotidyltransferase domain-containing protein [Solirubrobacterales bacterium]